MFGNIWAIFSLKGWNRRSTRFSHMYSMYSLVTSTVCDSLAKEFICSSPTSLKPSVVCAGGSRRGQLWEVEGSTPLAWLVLAPCLSARSEALKSLVYEYLKRPTVLGFILFLSASVTSSHNAVLCFQLLSRSSQVNLSKLIQQFLQQGPVHDPAPPSSACLRASLGPRPQHLVVSFLAGPVIQLCLLDLDVPHTESTHKLLDLLHGY